MSKPVYAINGVVDDFVGVVEHTAASIAIPVADGVVAWLAAENMVRALGFSWPVSIMTGLALEGCGIVVSRAALEVRYYNQTKAQDAPPALEWLAWTLLGAQFLIGGVLVTVNTVATSSMLFGLLTLATLSAVGTLAHMLENDIEARRSERAALPSSAQVAEVVADLAQPSARARLQAFYTENPHASQAAAASATGVSRQRVGQLRAELLAEGAIPSNGNGR